MNTLMLSELPEDTQRKVQQTRETVARLHMELVRWGLVVWTAGNVSQRVRCADQIGLDLMVIKPSGVRYEELTPESMVVCTLDGAKIEDGTSQSLVPSSDTAAHAFVYREMPDVGGVVHTHSTYATAWSALGKDLPCFLTMQSDEFGGPIPVGPFALIGDDSIGRGIVQTLRRHPSKAVLMANHGPFTIGSDATDAVKAAVMCEEVARTTMLALQAGQPVPIPPEAIAQLNDRYQRVYGQH